MGPATLPVQVMSDSLGTPGRVALDRLRLLRMLSIGSLVLGVGVVLALAYLASLQQASSRQARTQLLDSQESISRQALISSMEAGNVTLAASIANHLWEARIAPLLQAAEALPARDCRIEDGPRRGNGAVQGRACRDAVRRGLVELPEFRALDAVVRRHLRGSKIYRIKLYSQQGLTVYSTDHAHVGDDMVGNSGWQSAALRGVPASKLVFGEHFDEAERVVVKRDLISTYVPLGLRSRGGAQGVLEIYTDASEAVLNLEQASSRLRKLGLDDAAQDGVGHFGMLLSLTGLLAAVLGLQLVLVVRAGRSMPEPGAESGYGARGAYGAQYDALTELPNRFSFEHRLEQALLLSKREATGLAVIFIGLDGLEAGADGAGPKPGDQLLLEASRRIRSCVRESDIVARLGGDEFVVVLTGIDGAPEAGALVSKIHEALSRPYRLADRALQLVACMGVSLYPVDGQEITTLMKKADAAMRHVQGTTGAGYHFFTGVADKAALRRVGLERDLLAAFKNDGLSLHYQPQVRAPGGELAGFEALIRLNHPGRGMLLPPDFIEVAEDAGLMERVGAWVLENACRQLSQWRQQGYACPRIALNLSAGQLAAGDLPERVENALRSAGLKASDLEIEITESSIMEDPGMAVRQLGTLRNLGVSLAIDDFGTGYSSLAYLKRLPVHTLKLDRTLIADIESSAADRAICAAAITLAHNLDLKVVAEGVETAGQQALLVQLDCDFLQGDLFGGAESAAAAAAHWLVKPDLNTRVWPPGRDGRSQFIGCRMPGQRFGQLSADQVGEADDLGHRPVEFFGDFLAERDLGQHQGKIGVRVKRDIRRFRGRQDLLRELGLALGRDPRRLSAIVFERDGYIALAADRLGLVRGIAGHARSSTRVCAWSGRLRSGSGRPSALARWPGCSPAARRADSSSGRLRANSAWVAVASHQKVTAIFSPCRRIRL